MTVRTSVHGSIAVVGIILASALLLPCTTLRGQSTVTHLGDSGISHWWLGVEGGLSYVHQTFGFRLFDHPDGYIADGGTAIGGFGGLRIKYQLNRLWSTSFGVSYRTYPAEHTATHTNATWFSSYNFVNTAGTPGGPADTVIQYRTNVTNPAVSLELLNELRCITFDSSIALGLAFGPMLHIWRDITIRQSLTVLSPDSLSVTIPDISGTLQENSNTLIAYDGSMAPGVPFGFAIRMGLVAEFGNLEAGTIVSPMILYEYGLTNVSDTESWTISALTAQVSVMFRL